VLLRGSFVSCYLAAQLDCFLEHYLEQHAGVDNSSRRKKRRRFPGVVPLRCPFTRVLPLSSCFFHMIKARRRKNIALTEKKLSSFLQLSRCSFPSNQSKHLPLFLIILTSKSIPIPDQKTENLINEIFSLPGNFSYR